MKITDSQWRCVAPFLMHSPHVHGRGRPRCDPRKVFEGILFVLYTREPWRNIPGTSPSFKTCHRRFCELDRLGKIDDALCALQIHICEHLGIATLDYNTLVDLMSRPNNDLEKDWLIQTVVTLLSPEVRARLGRRSVRPQGVNNETAEVHAPKRRSLISTSEKSRPF